MAEPTDPKKDTVPASEPSEWERLLMEYFQELNSPLDMDDPEIRVILNAARSGSQAAAAARGIGGAASVRGGENAFIQASAGLRGQRQGMALNALGMGNDVDQRNRNRATDIRFREDEMDWRRWQAGVQSGQGMGQTIGSVVGGGLGLAAGLIGGPATMPLIPGLMTGGAALGGGIGGGIGSFASGGLRPPGSNNSGGY